MPTADPECPFCAIVAGNDPAVREIWRDRSVVAFFPDQPAVLGHTLVIPVEHAPFITELSSASTHELVGRVVRLAPEIVAAVGASGFNLIQSNGPAAEQTVPHVHFHVLPRWQDDRIGSLWPALATLPDASVESAWQRVRQKVNEIDFPSEEPTDNDGDACYGECAVESGD